MDTALSVLKLTSGMARHAADMQVATARNIAQIDVPGTKPLRVRSFNDSLEQIGRGEAPEQYEEQKPLSLETEVLTLAQARGRHDAAVAIWNTTLDMMRLAVGGPQR